MDNSLKPEFASLRSAPAYLPGYPGRTVPYVKARPSDPSHNMRRFLGNRFRERSFIVKAPTKRNRPVAHESGFSETPVTTSAPEPSRSDIVRAMCPASD